MGISIPSRPPTTAEIQAALEAEHFAAYRRPASCAALGDLAEDALGTPVEDAELGRVMRDLSQRQRSAPSAIRRYSLRLLGALGLFTLLLAPLRALASWREPSGEDASQIATPPDSSGDGQERRTVPPDLRDSLAALTALDPDFSRPLFCDFAQLIYTRVVEARASGNHAPVAAYVAPEVMASWSAPSSAHPTINGVREVVIGAQSLVAIDCPVFGPVRCEVEFEASMIETTDGADRPVWSKERWTFSRERSVRSRGPDTIRTLGCPSCAAPTECAVDGTCTYCGQVVARGRFHWVVTSATILERAARATQEELVVNGEEVGTDLPTVIAPDFSQAGADFLARNPGFQFPEFAAHVERVFHQLQRAWTEQSWEMARPLQTDSLYSSHRYWIERHRAAGVRNVLERVKVEKVTPARYDHDAFYEAITVRIFARMLDYTVDAHGAFLAGDKHRERRFSEYWTFIAARGTSLMPRENLSTCPACAAPLRISQTGVCEQCSAVVTTGRHGWVLSRIEQDESYLG